MCHLYKRNAPMQEAGGLDFQNFIYVKLKKKNNDKNYKKKNWRTVLGSYLSTDLLFY